MTPLHETLKLHYSNRSEAQSYMSIAESAKKARLESAIERQQLKLKSMTEMQNKLKAHFEPTLAKCKKLLKDLPKDQCKPELTKRFVWLRESHIARTVRILTVKYETE